MFVKLQSFALLGVEAFPISVEVNTDNGYKFHLVGLPDSAVKESEHRITAALNNIGYRMPGKKITINMAPADIRKEGSAYDATIALGILLSSEQIIGNDLSDTIVMGELSLNGDLLPIKGALSIALTAAKMGFKQFILPMANAGEASFVEGVDVFGAENLSDIIEYVLGTEEAITLCKNTWEDYSNVEDKTHYTVGFEDVKGQQNIKRALEIAAAGGHNVLLIGPPGAGKTLLARSLPTILPPMTLEESLETTKIHSISGQTSKSKGIVKERVFRSPHHTISDVALVGGGSYPQPGEISLAHNGVLFLDEMTEFNKSALEVMRQPMEDRIVHISRARFSVEYACNFILVGAINPCPCGFYNHPTKDCQCGPSVVQRYISKISGPILDRIDMHIEVTPVDYGDLASKIEVESSSEVRKRVISARNLQKERLQSIPGVHCNAQMNNKLVEKTCILPEDASELLKNAMTKFNLSARAHSKIIKLSRTIADLSNSDTIEVQHLAEAIQYRSLDKDLW